MANLICRYCDKAILEGQEVKTLSYWSHLPFVCHKECKQAGERQEAIDCQVIDADCNDCKHFKRGQQERRLMSCIENGQAGMRWVNMEYFDGHCMKLNKPTVAQPNKWTGHDCFEHRRL